MFWLGVAVGWLTTGITAAVILAVLAGGSRRRPPNTAITALD